MAEYIEREKVYNIFSIKQQELLKYHRYYQLNDADKEEFDLYDSYVNEVESIPAADVVEVKHGEWELHGNDDSLSCSYFCSSCGWNMDEDEFLDNWSHFKFCPNCGAKMDGKGD